MTDTNKLKERVRTIEAACEEIKHLRQVVEQTKTKAEAFDAINRILKLTGPSQGYGVDVIFNLNELLFDMKAEIATKTEKEPTE